MTWRRLNLLASILLIQGALSASDVGLGVLSLIPSLKWDGIDGKWSTFELEIGTPGQVVRLLPATSSHAGSVTSIVLPRGCSSGMSVSAGNCTDSRGNVYLSNHSTTWSVETLQDGGAYRLDTAAESSLGLEGGKANYGFDTIAFPCPQLPVMQGQLIAGYTSEDFWLGSFGLSPMPFNFSTFSRPVPSFLRSLKRDGHIKSLSWGYTAGAHYREENLYGSLTLGGYDASRLDESQLAIFPFGSDTARDLLVSISNITYDTLGSTPLLEEPVDAFIDSMVAQMWLPLSVCKQFELAFGLTWNDTSELYILDGDTHARLLAENPTFSFQLAAASSSAGNLSNIDHNTVHIRMPYAAFDLNVSSPMVPGANNFSSWYYFPLKRATDASQYTLGRVFLQEAYVLADYERLSFRVSQAQFPISGTPTSLEVIDPSDELDVNGVPEPSRVKFSTVIGVSVGSALLVAVSGFCVAWWLWRKRRLRKALVEGTDYSADEKAQRCSSVDDCSSNGMTELSASDTGVHEMQEAEAECAATRELEGSVCHELTSNVSNAGKDDEDQEQTARSPGRVLELP